MSGRIFSPTKWSSSALISRRVSAWDVNKHFQSSLRKASNNNNKINRIKNRVQLSISVWLVARNVRYRCLADRFLRCRSLWLTHTLGEPPKHQKTTKLRRSLSVKEHLNRYLRSISSFFHFAQVTRFVYLFLSAEFTFIWVGVWSSLSVGRSVWRSVLLVLSLAFRSHRNNRCVSRSDTRMVLSLFDALRNHSITTK